MPTKKTYRSGASHDFQKFVFQNVCNNVLVLEFIVFFPRKLQEMLHWRYSNCREFHLKDKDVYLLFISTFELQISELLQNIGKPQPLKGAQWERGVLGRDIFMKIKILILFCQNRRTREFFPLQERFSQKGKIPKNEKLTSMC